MANQFPQQSPDICQPGLDMYEVVPDDNTVLDPPGRAFQVRGDAGDVSVVTRAGNIRDINDVQAFERVEQQITKVRSTNTTATRIWVIV